MQTALLLIDIQNDYFPGGMNELVGPEEASLQAKKLLQAFRSKKLPVFHIQHISTRPGATFFLPGTTGCEIHRNVMPIDGEIVIQKHYPNSFRDTKLLEELTNHHIEQLVVCGMMTLMCVDSTIRAAYDNGFSCIVAQDACATKDIRFGNEIINAELVNKSFLSAFNGMFATVKSTKDIY
jgi:nicotinamidase-related amidase